MAGVLQLKDHFRAGDVVVVIFHDHGSRYLGKMFNDEWMRSNGFLDTEWHAITLADVVNSKSSSGVITASIYSLAVSLVLLLGVNSWADGLAWTWVR